MKTLGVCQFPDRLHPMSAQLLGYLIRGEMHPADFKRFFSLPNSDYIQLAECILVALGHDRDPRKIPPSLEG